MPDLKVKVELPESEQHDVCSSTFMNPIGGDLWRGINVWTGRKHSLSPSLSDSVNTLLSHINHHFTVNRHCMLPAQIKNGLCLVLPASLQLWGTHWRYCCYSTRLYISISDNCATKVAFKVSGVLYHFHW